MYSTFFFLINGYIGAGIIFMRRRRKKEEENNEEEETRLSVTEEDWSRNGRASI